MLFRIIRKFLWLGEKLLNGTCLEREYTGLLMHSLDLFSNSNKLTFTLVRQFLVNSWLNISRRWIYNSCEFGIQLLGMCWYKRYCLIPGAHLA
jgi:hypothetical protein